MAAGTLPIAGFQPTSLIDYPDRVAAVLFTAGCNLRCPFCHNPDLVLPESVVGLTLFDTQHVISRLEERASFLDGVVITGGEPTLHPGLGAFLRRLKSLGLLIKLDTNGTDPDVLGRLLEAGLVDFVAMDVKASRMSYERLAGTAVDLEAIGRSIETIRDRVPEHEFRTTVAPTLDAGEILAIADWIGAAKHYVLQRFRVPDAGLVDSTWGEREALSSDELRRIWERISGRFDGGGVRG